MSGGEIPSEAREVFGTPGFAWRVGLSIFVVFGWLAFMLIWLFFYAGDYNGYQNLAIVITSLLILGAVTSSTWIVRWLRVMRKRT